MYVLRPPAVPAGTRCEIHQYHPQLVVADVVHSQQTPFSPKINPPRTWPLLPVSKLSSNLEQRPISNGSLHGT